MNKELQEREAHFPDIVVLADFIRDNYTRLAAAIVQIYAEWVDSQTE